MIPTDPERELSAELRAESDHLLVDIHPQALRVSLDLAQAVPAPPVSNFPNCSDGVTSEPEVTMGPVWAVLCYRPAGKFESHSVGWDRDGTVMRDMR